MKRLITILPFLIIGLFSFAQRSATPGFSARTNQSFVVEDGNLSARNALYAPRYTDTTQANTYILKDTIGNVIFCYSTMSLWVRVYDSGKKWQQVGSGGGSTPGIDDVLAVGQAITENREVELNGKSIQFLRGAIPFFLINSTPDEEDVFLQATNLTGDRNVALFNGFVTPANASFEIYADFQDGQQHSSIQLGASDGLATALYEANTHTFNGGDNTLLSLDNTTGNSYLRGFNNTAGGNEGSIQASGQAGTAGFLLKGEFDGGATTSQISGAATSGTSNLTFTAVSYIIQNVQAFANDAAATGGGLTTGMLYKTTTGGSTFLKIVP